VAGAEAVSVRFISPRGAAHQQVIVAFREELLIAPAPALFQDHHSHENAYGSVGTTVIRRIKDTENIFIYTRYNML